MKKILVIIIVSLFFYQKLYSYQTESGETFNLEALSPETRNAVAQFRLGLKDQSFFTLKPLPNISSAVNYKKNYLIPGLEVVAVNVIVWSYDRFVLKSGWTKISLKSIFFNLKFGYEWDNNSFKANQFEHPFHGSMYHSAARIHGLSYLESAIYSFLGSFMWEFFLETNRPSANDQIMTALGGITLGEVLFKVSDLAYHESSTGPQNILRQSLIFVINPVYGFNLIVGKSFKIRTSSEKHYYDLSIPVGFYDSSTDQPIFLIAMNIEYKDALRKESSALSPYDWFSSNLMLGVNKGGLRDKEILTTGFIVGQRVRNSLVGIFGVFDYMDTQTSEMMSAVGFGPGFFTSVRPRSNLFFKSYGILSAIFGASSSSLDLDYQRLTNEKNYPYALGPGMLGRMELEFEKQGFGNISSRFSQYWIHSIRSDANELLSILSSNLKIHLSKTSQIGLGYSYYFRHSIHHKLHFAHRRNAVFVLYILRF